MRLAVLLGVMSVLIVTPAGESAARSALLLEGTVVTMSDAHTVIPNGRVLVRGGIILAIWAAPNKPAGLNTSDARVVKGGLIFPGLINIHDHPAFDVLPLWPPPSSHAQPYVGRPTGREPYGDRYQWGTTSPPEYRRLVQAPHDALTSRDALNLARQVIVHEEVRDALGGETATQGEPTDAPNGLLIRNVDGTNFGRDRIEEQVQNIADGGSPGLAARMADGSVDAWLVHLAEGARDIDLAPGDSYSSRMEFDELRRLELLTDKTVIIHGTALERGDFEAMRVAGAKLVWSPLSNLLLYGHTTQIYAALEQGVNVSLGTDWSPSGSKTLLDELKIADIALRDRRVLGPARPGIAIDRLLADMVTRNPARALRWPEVGSIETGKHGDLLMLRRSSGSPYRSLIDATQRDVRLVLVDGEPVAGDPDAMKAAGATVQLVRSSVGHFVKAVPKRLALASVETTLRTTLHGLGDVTWLRRHWNGGRDRAMTDAAFRDNVLAPRYGRVGARVNLESIELSPLFTRDDHFFFSVLHARKDPKAPFRLYPMNSNQVGPAGNPFAGLKNS
jgi:5-methylthioadenosine/S-adenosylhomocysteine deaminase